MCLTVTFIFATIIISDSEKNDDLIFLVLEIATFSGNTTDKKRAVNKTCEY